jgi:hypothetical protein
VKRNYVKWRWLATGTALLALTLAGLSRRLPAQSRVLPFRLAHNTLVVVSVWANGTGPFDFILDTGTETTIVDVSVARQLSLPSLGHIQLNSLARTQAVTGSSLRNLTVGPAQAENLDVLVEDLREAHQIDPFVRGVVGQDFLRHYNYLLDYEERSLRIELGNEIRAKVEGDLVPFQVSGRRMIVTSEVNSTERATLRLTLDSGANSILLMGRAARFARIQEKATASVVNGGIQIPVGRVSRLSIGSRQFHNVDVGLPPEPERWGQIEDGILPTVLFRGLYVNNQDHFVVFNPQFRTK